MRGWAKTAGVRLRPEFVALLALTNGARFSVGRREALLGGEFQLLDFREIRRGWDALCVSSNDSLTPFEDVLPLFRSGYGEWLGFQPSGAAPTLLEVSLSQSPARLAFSSLVSAIDVFAAYFTSAQKLVTPGLKEFDLFKHIHQTVDPTAAEAYWAG